MEYAEKLIERAEKKKIEEADAKKVEGTTQTVEDIENPPLGPGGLDPVEVFESLPKEMQSRLNLVAPKRFVNTSMLFR